MAEPLNAAVYSATDMVNSGVASARASGESNPGRAANAGSFSSAANDTFHGHTSWGEWPENRFEIPLSTGRLTLKRTMT